MPSFLSRMAAPLRIACDWTGISRARARGVPSARILTFHGIQVAEHPVEVFHAQLRFLSENFTIVPLDRLIDGALSGAGRGLIALTFDDGLRNQVAAAAPLLTELRMPATFFVCPDLVDRGSWQWCHEVRERLGSLGWVERRRILDAIGAPRRGTERALEWMKDLVPAKRESVVELIRRRTVSFVATPEQSWNFDVASWDELHALPPELFTIGSHGADHQVLKGLSEAELRRQIAGSRWKLENTLRRRVEWFSYPNGRYDDAAWAEVRETYRGALTMSSGFVDAGADRHRLPRINVTADMSLFFWRLHRPRR